MLEELVRICFGDTLKHIKEKARRPFNKITYIDFFSFHKFIFTINLPKDIRQILYQIQIIGD